jgi:hypothetical protein
VSTYAAYGSNMDPAQNAYEGGLPAARYLGIIADAAEAAGAPDDCVKALRERPCT